jgi:hypothetical protein
MCKCHQPTKQCQPTYKKIEEKAMKKHEFTLTKYKTLHLTHNGCTSVLNGIMGCNPLPIIGATGEVNPHGVY